MANLIEQNDVHLRGAGDRAMVFAHGSTGHCPNRSAPDEVIAAMRVFVS